MLKAKFRFRAGHRDSFHIRPPWKLCSIFLNLTERCNLNCDYCHALPDRPAETMPHDLVNGILDQAAAMGDATILLTGGEPFCYPHLEEVLKGCQRRNLACKIATNGTLLDDAHVAMLLRYGVQSLQVSLDTMDPHMYAKAKGAAPGTFQDVVDGIQRCVQTGKLHLAVSSVARRASQSGLAEVLEFCHDRHVNTFTVYKVIPFGRAAANNAQELGEEEFIQLLDGLFARFVQLREHWAVDLGFPWAADSTILRKWEKQVSIKPIGCVAGKSNLTILANGDVVPCVCMEDRHLSCGNVGRSSLAELWDAPVMRYFRGQEPIEGCAGCPQFAFCLGGCRTMAYLTSGRDSAPDPICRHWRVQPAATTRPDMQ